MSIYLYVDDICLTLLREGKLPFKLASSLQDPFLDNRSDAPQETVAEVSVEALDQELQAQYAALPESLSSLMSFDYFKSQALKKRESFEQKIQERGIPKAQALSESQQGNMAVLSLYKSGDNVLNWQRYAGNYRGMVIELDNQHAYFREREWNKRPQMFNAVNYSDVRPVAGPQPQPFRPLFARSSLYANEEELRLLRPISAADKHSEQLGRDLYWYKLPNNVIKSFTFGPLMPENLKSKLLELIRFDLRYRHLPVNQCWIDSTKYEMQIKEIVDE